MWCGVISIFPNMFNVLKKYGITKYAYENNILNFDFFNPKYYTYKNLKKIYNKPSGGGDGLVMSFSPLYNAICNAKLKKPDAITAYVTPKGKIINQDIILNLSKYKSIIFLAGRYEDIDYRLIENKIDVEISLGNYIISGGDLAIIIIIDAISRLLPGVIKNINSTKIESFNNNLLDYQQYTKPNLIMNYYIPKILISGNHTNIKKWRYMQRLGFTFLKRPDLLFKYKLSNDEKILLKEFIFHKYN